MEFTLESKRTPKVLLFLGEGIDRSIFLYGVNEQGENRAIMEFKNGRFQRYNCQELDQLDTEERGGIKEFIDESCQNSSVKEKNGNNSQLKEFMKKGKI